jgi:hypothetical protein
LSPGELTGTTARLPGGCGGRWIAGVDDPAQPHRLPLIGVRRGGVHDAGHGLPQVLQAGDLVVDGVQVRLQQGDDLGTGWRLAAAEADDRADFGQAEPELAGLADEAQQLDVVIGVTTVTRGGSLGPREQAARLIQPDGLGGQACAPGGLAYGKDLRGDLRLLGLTLP